ncbi:TetR/AcrR family transcriptional regulator [Algoriphagus aestuariicola]|uniref:TetR/AcrR family transcriptional regulator n=1 Tax=Algoriphagus aestuariicola TaxID=1852016 RepID=A0ABS3BSG0_9BACT|nr:TetR/AcrR family transcriptional regulator [Algoriphagus aestuariicola]MBN7802217.1 TetR/AcrR family transcriptional regulator [Algoriphagus aestuariicola]
MTKPNKPKTKDKILSVAIRMFNEAGVQGITSRHIAAEMGISHGNLDYHYHTKEDLILAIYEKMRLEASESYGTRKPHTSSFEHFHRMISELEEFQYRYRFFNLDVLEISRSFPLVNKKIQETLILRKQQSQQLFEEFLRDGFVSFPEEDVMERILHTIRMVITFWLSQLEVISPYKFQQKGEMVRLVWNTILPYLTPAGKEEYERVLDLAASQVASNS